MTGITNKITRSLAPALVTAALIAPTAGAYQDISSQDMRNVAEPGAPASDRHDLRSQDALDAARSLPPDQLAAVAEGLRPAHHDLRSQDALDAARSLPPGQLAVVAEGLRSGADGSDVGLVPGGVLDLVRIRLAGVAPSLRALPRSSSPASPSASDERPSRDHTPRDVKLLDP